MGLVHWPNMDDDSMREPMSRVLGDFHVIMLRKESLCHETRVERAISMFTIKVMKHVCVLTTTLFEFPTFACHDSRVLLWMWRNSGLTSTPETCNGKCFTYSCIQYLFGRLPDWFSSAFAGASSSKIACVIVLGGGFGNLRPTRAGVDIAFCSQRVVGCCWLNTQIELQWGTVVQQ